MKKIALFVFVAAFSGLLKAQDDNTIDMVKNGFTIKIAVDIPTNDFGMIPGDEYLETQYTRPGIGLDFGRMWFINGWDMGDLVLGVDATILSLNYNVVSGENKIEAVTGQRVYKYDYRHISISTMAGPSLTYLWNSDLATDIAVKIAPTINYFYYQHSVDNEYYKNPNIQMGVALKVHPSINLRYKQYLVGMEYSMGSANYTDFRDSHSSNVQTNDLIISLNMFRIYFGFKL